MSVDFYICQIPRFDHEETVRTAVRLTSAAMRAVPCVIPDHALLLEVSDAGGSTTHVATGLAKDIAVAPISISHVINQHVHYYSTYQCCCIHETIH